MCLQCIKIEERIKSLREIEKLTTDLPARDAIASLTESLKAEKLALHPDQRSPGG
jgi:hypothetical protein